MAFHDSAVFPFELKSLRVSPGWRTDVIKLGGGAEQRIAIMGDALRVFDAALGIKTLSDWRTVEKHLNGRRGRLHGFPLLDRSNCTALTEPLGTGTGALTTFQLTLNDGDSSNAYNREIYKPKSGTILIYDNAVLKTETTHYTINYATGIVTFLVAPVAAHVLTWSGTFYVPVRYDVDAMPDAELFEFFADGTGHMQGSIPMVEIRDIS